MSNLTIRPAVPEDLNRLWTLVQRAVEKMNAEGNEQWGPDYPTQDVYAADIVRGELWVAVDCAQQLCGVALLTTAIETDYESVPWVCTGPALVIHRMAIDPAKQRCGVGAALICHAQALARDKMIPVLHMDTYCKNQAMQALMTSQGFVKRGEINLHRRPMPFLCFEKVLITNPQ